MEQNRATSMQDAESLPGQLELGFNSEQVQKIAEMAV